MEKSTAREVQIHIGALSPSLQEQLEQQGLRFKEPQQGLILQKAIDSLNFLRIHSIVLGEKKKLETRLFTRILSSIEEDVEPDSIEESHSLFVQSLERMTPEEKESLVFSPFGQEIQKVVFGSQK